MRKILLSNTKPGMILAKTIYSEDGKALLTSGTRLQQTYIDKLKLLNIPAIYIKDEQLPLLELPDAIQDETRQRAIGNIKDVFNQFASGKKVELKKITESVNEMIDELLENRHIVFNLAEIRSHDNYTFAHCANVCALSILTGISLNFNQLQLKELGIGAILHDVGKISINKDILNKPATLTTEEFSLIKEHSTSGFEILRKIDDISLLSAHVPFQHHEKIDGTGYPRGLKGNDIHLYAKIVAVADVYDALVADRVYRHAYSAYEAAEVITSGTNTHFDEKVVDAFLKNIAIFPIGSLVKLNTGAIAVVVNNTKGQTRPIIRILHDRHDPAQGYGPELNLDEHPDLIIEKILKPSDPEYIV